MPRDDVWKYLCFSVVEPLLLLIYLVLVSARTEDLQIIE